MKYVLLAILFLYRRCISPVLAALGVRCRFHPSCSSYAETALRAHGAIVGSVLAAGRLLRCHPLSRGGFDPVPEMRARREKSNGLSRARLVYREPRQGSGGYGHGK